MTTAMQELYLELEKITEISNTILITDIQRMIGNYYNDIEKMQITEAYEEGRDYGLCLNGNEYYKNTYKK
jgi:hypothetical protein